MLVHELVDQAAARRPDAPALRDADGGWTYADLAANSRGAATWLSGQGVVRGDRVAVRAVPTRVFLALLYGCSRLGAAFVPLHPELPDYQLDAVLPDLDAALLLTDPEDVTRAGREFATLPGRPGTDGHPGDPVLMLYTSGSTALPKAVVCPHEPVLFAVQAIARRTGYRADDVVFCRLPLAFDYGLYQAFLSALAGCELVLADPAADAGLLVRMREVGTTVVPVVPILAQMLVRLASRRGPVPGVRLFTNTGEHLAPATAEALRQGFAGARVQPMFGTTECKRITIAEPDEDLARPGSVGRALDGTRVAIVDPQGRPLPAGEVGEVVVTGPHLMAGYWRAPEETGRRFRTDPASGVRALFTGDFGRLDAEGNLYFHGRRDDLFKQRGTRTSTTEIEAAAQSLSAVTAAAVVAPASPEDHAVLCVVTDLPPEQVQRELTALLGPSKVPPVCRVLPSLPTTPNGKVDRRRLAEVVRR